VLHSSDVEELVGGKGVGVPVEKRAKTFALHLEWPPNGALVDALPGTSGACIGATGVTAGTTGCTTLLGVEIAPCGRISAVMNGSWRIESGFAFSDMLCGATRAGSLTTALLACVGLGWNGPAC